MEEITSQPASLFITIADCCNNFTDRPKGMLPFRPEAVIAKSYTPNSNKEALKKLFLRTQGLIIASGSIPGKRSWWTEKGGLFTNALLASLKDELNEVDPQWEHLFKKVNACCSNVQQPQFHLKIRYSKGIPNRKQRWLYKPKMR